MFHYNLFDQSPVNTFHFLELFFFCKYVIYTAFKNRKDNLKVMKDYKDLIVIGNPRIYLLFTIYLIMKYTLKSLW